MTNPNCRYSNPNDIESRWSWWLNKVQLLRFDGVQIHNGASRSHSTTKNSESGEVRDVNFHYAPGRSLPTFGLKIHHGFSRPITVKGFSGSADKSPVFGLLWGRQQLPAGENDPKLMPIKQLE